MYQELNEKEEQEFRQCIYDDKIVNDFMKYVNLWHPVTKDELCKRIKKGKE